MDILVWLIAALAAYLLGSIPSGYLAGRARGLDIRTMGSGNIGATNAFRILGKPAGTLVLIADGMKGWIAVALVPPLVMKLIYGHAPDDQSETLEYLRILAGVVAVLGHNYTFWLKFKGGKGIATSAGVLSALVPIALVVILTTWIVVCFLTRYVSVASIAASAVLPFATWFAHYGLTLTVITGLMAALAIYKHKANIVRLMNGSENKIGGRKSLPDGKEIS